MLGGDGWRWMGGSGCIGVDLRGWVEDSVDWWLWMDGSGCIVVVINAWWWIRSSNLRVVVMQACLPQPPQAAPKKQGSLPPQGQEAAGRAGQEAEIW